MSNDSSVQRIALTDPDEEGKWFDPSRSQYWAESTRWDGSNHISVATGSQWHHEELFRTTHSGTFILHAFSNYQNERDEYGTVSAKDAAAWLVQNGHDIPSDLAEITAGG